MSLSFHHRRAALAVALALAAGLTACATATGPEFTNLASAPADKGRLYLYRKSALYAAGAAYRVTQDGKEVGQLFNASYLAFDLPPGQYKFGVDERGFTTVKNFDVKVEAGRNYFVEYDSSKGLLLGLGLLSGSQEKPESQALADLKGLKRAN